VRIFGSSGTETISFQGEGTFDTSHVPVFVIAFVNHSLLVTSFYAATCGIVIWHIHELNVVLTTDHLPLTDRFTAVRRCLFLVSLSVHLRKSRIRVGDKTDKDRSHNGLTTTCLAKVRENPVSCCMRFTHRTITRIVFVLRSRPQQNVPQ